MWHVLMRHKESGYVEMAAQVHDRTEADKICESTKQYWERDYPNMYELWVDTSETGWAIMDKQSEEILARLKRNQK